MQSKLTTGSIIAILGTGFAMSAPVAAEYPDFEIRGRLMLDYHIANEDKSDGFVDGFNNRRARLGAGGRITPDWDGRVEANVAEGSLSAADFRLRRSLANGGRLWLGQFKVPQGLNQLTSSNNITFMERSSISNLVADSRRIGAAYEHTVDDFHLKTMFFQRALGDDEGDGEDYKGDQPKGLALRGVFAPHVGAGRLHIGGSIVREDQDEDFDTRVSDRPELRDGDGGSVRFIDVTANDVEDSLKTGLELAYIRGPLSFEAEYLRTDFNTGDGSDPEIDGWHIQGSYVLTGESRSYSTGGFGGITPASSRGAWEVAGRVSHVDATDSAFGDDGAEQTNLTLGVNYYQTSNLRFMANVVFVNTEFEEAGKSDDDPVLFGARAQYNF